MFNSSTRTWEDRFAEKREECKYYARKIHELVTKNTQILPLLDTGNPILHCEFRGVTSTIVIAFYQNNSRLMRAMHDGIETLASSPTENFIFSSVVPTHNPTGAFATLSTVTESLCTAMQEAAATVKSAYIFCDKFLDLAALIMEYDLSVDDFGMNLGEGLSFSGKLAQPFQVYDQHLHDMVSLLRDFLDTAQCLSANFSAQRLG